MAAVIRAFLSILAGLTLAGGLVIGVEAFSAIVYPTPPGFTGTKEEMCEHVASYPQWVLAVCSVAWYATAFASTWVATKLGRRVPGVVVGLLLLLAVVFNVSMLPYPMWFKLIAPAGVVIGCVLAIGPLATRRADQQVKETGSAE
jgi:hypothetical protein